MFSRAYDGVAEFPRDTRPNSYVFFKHPVSLVYIGLVVRADERHEPDIVHLMKLQHEAL